MSNDDDIIVIQAHTCLSTRLAIIINDKFRLIKYLLENIEHLDGVIAVTEPNED